MVPEFPTLEALGFPSPRLKHSSLEQPSLSGPLEEVPAVVGCLPLGGPSQHMLGYIGLNAEWSPLQTRALFLDPSVQELPRQPVCPKLLWGKATSWSQHSWNPFYFDYVVSFLRHLAELAQGCGGGAQPGEDSVSCFAGGRPRVGAGGGQTNQGVLFCF